MSVEPKDLASAWSLHFENIIWRLREKAELGRYEIWPLQSSIPCVYLYSENLIFVRNVNNSVYLCILKYVSSPCASAVGTTLR